MCSELSKFTKNVRVWAAATPEVRSVILFGSRAKGNFTANSDWDICILVEDANPTHSAWYGLWVEKADSWHAKFCEATGLNMSDVQFVAPTNNKIKEGIADCSKVLYVRDTVQVI